MCDRVIKIHLDPVGAADSQSDLRNIPVRVHVESDAGCELSATVEGKQLEGLASRASSFGWRRDWREAVGLGSDLFKLLLGGESEGPFRQALSEAQAEDEVLAIEVQYVPGVPQLHALPIELMFDTSERCFLSLSGDITIRRHIRLSKGRVGSAADPVRRLLISSSAPRGLQRLDARLEIEAITKAAVGSTLKVTPLHNASEKSIAYTLKKAKGNSRPYGAWMHVGHGDYFEKQGFLLAMEDDSGGISLVAPGKLAGTVAEHGVHVAVLNVCEGAGPTGLAEELAKVNIPVVIGHCTKVLDRAAIRFSASLWRHLSRGATVGTAMGHARLAMCACERPLEWTTPMAILRGPDARLVGPLDPGEEP